MIFRLKSLRRFNPNIPTPITTPKSSQNDAAKRKPMDWVRGTAIYPLINPPMVALTAASMRVETPNLLRALSR